MNKQEKTEAIKMLEEFQETKELSIEEMLISQMMINDLEREETVEKK